MQVGAFIEGLQSAFYRPQGDNVQDAGDKGGADRGVDDANASLQAPQADHVFASLPLHGAAVIRDRQFVAAPAQ